MAVPADIALKSADFALPLPSHAHSLNAGAYRPSRASSSASGSQARKVQHAISNTNAEGMDLPNHCVPPLSMYLHSSSASLLRLGLPSLWVPPRLFAATRNTLSTE